MKHWIEGNQIIVVTDNDILFGNYRKLTLKKFSDKINSNEIPERLTGISFKYIKEIKVDPESKNIVFKLGKSSIEVLSFKSTSDRNIILNEILSKNHFNKSNSDISVAYKKFLKSFFIISLLFISILIVERTTSSGYSLHGQAIGLTSLWLKENLGINTIFILYILFIMVVFLRFILNIKKEKRSIKYYK